MTLLRVLCAWLQIASILGSKSTYPKGVFINPKISDVESFDGEELSMKHFNDENYFKNRNEIYLHFTHELKEHKLLFKKSDLFHDNFSVSKGDSNITNYIDKLLNKNCYYNSKHGSVSFCNTLNGKINLNNQHYIINSQINNNNILFQLKKDTSIMSQHQNTQKRRLQNCEAQNSIASAKPVYMYDGCDGGFYDATKTKQTAHIEVFIGVGSRLQKYAYSDNGAATYEKWSNEDEIISSVVDRFNLFVTHYNQMGFDPNNNEASLSFRWKLKHIHIVDKENEIAFTKPNHVGDYVNSLNLENVYGPWDYGAMFIYGTLDIVADPNSDFAVHKRLDANNYCTFGCAGRCSVCATNFYKYFATDPERYQNMEHEGGHNLGATHDGCCGGQEYKPQYCAESGVMCPYNAWSLPKGIGCSYDEIGCCISNILDGSNTCLDSFDTAGYTTSQDYCHVTQSFTADTNIIQWKTECKNTLEMTSDKLITSIHVTGHEKIEFKISVASLNDGYTGILMVGDANGDINDRNPSIFLHKEANGNVWLLVSLTNKASGFSDYQCISQSFTLPVEYLPISIDINKSKSQFIVTVNNQRCSETFSDNINYYFEDKNVYVPSGYTDDSFTIVDLTITSTFEGDTDYCEFRPRYVDNDKIIECIGVFPKTEGEALYKIPLVNHMKFEFLLSQTSFVSLVNLFFGGTSAPGNWQNSYPRVFIDHARLFVGFSNGGYEFSKLCGSTKITYPAFKTPISIEVDQTGNNLILTITIDGVECTDGIKNAHIRYPINVLKDIYVPASNSLMMSIGVNVIEDFTITIYDAPIDSAYVRYIFNNNQQVYASSSAFSDNDNSCDGDKFKLDLVQDVTIDSNGLNCGHNGYAISKFFQTDITEKSLEFYGQLSANVPGSAPLSIQKWSRNIVEYLFDAIVFAERQPYIWMAGSDYFKRTQDIVDATTIPINNNYEHIIITYKNNNGETQIKLYRNGVQYGKTYTYGSITTYALNTYNLLFCKRAVLPVQSFGGTIKMAALYNYPLTDSQALQAYDNRDSPATNNNINTCTYDTGTSLQCASNSYQVGIVNKDISGCGLEGCDARYNKGSITECEESCVNNVKCIAYNWAPLYGDNYFGQKVCTLYDSDVPNNNWGPQQIFCRLKTSSKFNLLTCPSGTTQIGEINADIYGCGLENCDNRYDLSNIDSCKQKCVDNINCLAFNWAPIYGDMNFGRTVCTIYDFKRPNNIWGPNQIFCGMDGRVGAKTIPMKELLQPPPMRESFIISLNSQWVIIIGVLLSIIFTFNIIFMCYMNCCKSRNGIPRISFNKNRRSGYDSVKHIDSEDFDDSEVNLINVN